MKYPKASNSTALALSTNEQHSSSRCNRIGTRNFYTQIRKINATISPNRTQISYILVYQDFTKIDFFFTILTKPRTTRVNEIKGQSLGGF